MIKIKYLKNFNLLEMIFKTQEIFKIIFKKSNILLNHRVY